MEYSENQKTFAGCLTRSLNEAGIRPQISHLNMMKEALKYEIECAALDNNTHNYLRPISDDWVHMINFLVKQTKRWNNLGMAVIIYKSCKVKNGKDK